MSRSSWLSVPCGGECAAVKDVGFFLQVAVSLIGTRTRSLSFLTVVGI